jgi:GNAT superfamily N-acetyltransferase
MDNVVIQKVSDLRPDTLSELLAESERTGFRFIRKLMDEWVSGFNRFDKPGEALFTASVDSRIVGIGGLNQDPYADQPGNGRVRRLYVLEEFRRRGVGRRLVDAIVTHARGQFNVLRLRTNTELGGRFYLALGFERCSVDQHSSHELILSHM